MPENSHIELVEEHDQDLAGRNQIVQSLKRSAADDFVLAELGVGFQFVAETGIARPKGTGRALIYSRRARGKRSSRNQTSQQKRVTRPLRPKIESDGTKDLSKLAVIGRSGHLTPLRDVSGHINRGPTTDWFDPFDALPIDKRGDSHYILTQYNAMFYPNDNPYSPTQSFTKEDILSFAMSDAASLHVFLTYVAMSISNPTNPKLVLDAAFHFGQAISLINNRIADHKHEVVTNATIFAVGCLAHAEIANNSIARLQMHLDGLAALVKMKGGIQALASHPFTFRFTRWVDNVCSIAMGSKPRFGFVNPAPHADPTHWEPYSDTGLRYRTRLSNLTGLEELTEETMEVYRILRNLMAEKHKTKMGITKEEFESYADLLMHRLIHIVQYKISEFPNQNALIFGLFGHAALAHVTTFIGNPARRGSVLELMSTRIRASLEVIDVQSFQVAFPEMMLWIIMVGGLASTGTENQGWFAELFSESCLAVGINGATELALFLLEFLWSDAYIGPVCKEFWDDFATAHARKLRMRRVVMID